jgi:hypothetical protein
MASVADVPPGLIITHTTIKKHAVSELNDLCLSCLNQKHQSLLEYIKQIPKDKQDYWNPIIALLDNQIVRFELWNAEIEVEGEDETFPHPDEYLEHASTAYYTGSKVLQIVEAVLRELHGQVVNLSGAIVKSISELPSMQESDEYVSQNESGRIFTPALLPLIS